MLVFGLEVKDVLILLNVLYVFFGVIENLIVEVFYLFEWREIELLFCGIYFFIIDLVGGNCYGGFMLSGNEFGVFGVVVIILFCG